MTSPEPGTALSRLRSAYAQAKTTPAAEAERSLAAIEATSRNHAFITVATPEQVERSLENLDKLATRAGGPQSLPLYGVPMAVKDNIDVQGFPTTNACPAFAYEPEESAHAVEQIVEAGAIVMGKTNLDQFATGLVGVRSPYGFSESVYGQGIVSGGSSSGSALAVATGVVPVALATDTAGSGRVPAALNGIVGIKPTLGLVSTRGLLPACRSIDGITVMSTSVEDGLTVLRTIVGPDPRNPWGRTPAQLAPSQLDAGWRAPRIGLPAESALEFFGDDAMRAAHLAARGSAVETLSATTVPVDLEPFLEAGALLYAGAWVAERLADMGEFFAAHADEVHPVVREIIEGGAQYSAADGFRTQHKLRSLRHAVRPVWDDVDALLIPTIGTTVTMDEIAAEPFAKNATLGHYTHFGNLLDLAAIAIPAGTTSDGRPCSLMLVGPPYSDLTLASIAARLMPAN
ncbi:allophanate hydrolase [Spongisporangium articulatum]|uniref:Allophanate hydrolase n=1 Tax=Spongisporangium articulatum TaxID=3362603 RepID=A0ABW8AGV4_9ACTN